MTERKILTTMRAGFRSYCLVLSGTLLLTLPIAGSGAGYGLQAQPNWPKPVHDDALNGKVLFDRLEYQVGDGEDVLLWDAQAWYGDNFNRLWIETEGERVLSGGEGTDLENLDFQYSRRITPYFDLQAGLGYQAEYESGLEKDRGFLVLGLQGLAPYWFEVDSNLRLSHDGDLSFDAEAEYDWLLTQRLILQGRGETAFAFTDVRDFGVGSGLKGLTLGLRLRYQIRRELAPYLGVSWDNRFGDTGDIVKEEGGSTQEIRAVAGIRWWF